eukprot:12926337-Prorocentrum_lima.AAC.1
MNKGCIVDMCRRPRAGKDKPMHPCTRSQARANYTLIGLMTDVRHVQHCLPLIILVNERQLSLTQWAHSSISGIRHGPSTILSDTEDCVGHIPGRAQQSCLDA